MVRPGITRRRALSAGLWTALAGVTASACADDVRSDADGPLTLWSALRGTDTLVAAWNELHPEEPVDFSP
ncbi:hypothetical protein [Streptomyces cyaneofuscatus]|uniref:hypothetical protein n=1 Tax=Streptomyces cyaneofuscatus TaxID=66883 RepID=UPI0037AA27DF